jgi:NADH-quinone oxidoreductase subunit J
MPDRVEKGEIMELNIALLCVMVISSFWTVMARSLIRAMLGLALTSLSIVVLMFRLDSPLAGVFELSVCTGLITVIFAATVSLTKPLNNKEIVARTKSRLKRFWFLPVLAILGGVLAFFFLRLPEFFQLPPETGQADVRNILWNLRHLDVIGQIVVVLAGAFGVLVLFKEIKNK